MRFVLSLCLLISSFVMADSLTELTAQAQQQNPNAQYQLALSYQQGNGVVKNLDNAFIGTNKRRIMITLWLNSNWPMPISKV
ncbi:hypothetical protein MCT03_03910 [Vibrio aestuarianus]|nr:hypothetical protein [Vibrio aestuarianus]